MVNEPSNLISSRRQEITAELARIAKLSEELQNELSELDVAERVIARLSATESPDQFKVSGEARKPDGLPTVPEMIVLALEEAKGEELRGLEPKEILTRIVRSWWPEIPPNVVSSTAWRMWKGGRLRKDGSTYMLLQKNEAAGHRSKNGPTASKTAPFERAFDRPRGRAGTKEIKMEPP